MQKYDRSRGFSLIELMVGMAVFSILCLALSGTVIFTMRASQRNVVKNTAYTTAQAFLEQIKSLPEKTLHEAYRNPSSVPLPTRSVSALEEGAVEIDDPIYLSDPNADSIGSNHKKILIDLKKTGSEQARAVVMDYWVNVAMTPMRAGRGYFIVMEFKYQCPGLDTLARGAGERLTMVRSTGLNP